MPRLIDPQTMKLAHAIVLGMIALPSSLGHAAVVDLFDCTVENRDANGTVVMKVSNSTGVARREFESSPAKGVTVTEGKLEGKVENPSSQAYADYTVWYRHAVQRDSSGKIVRAIQGLSSSQCVRL